MPDEGKEAFVEKTNKHHGERASTGAFLRYPSKNNGPPNRIRGIFQAYLEMHGLAHR